MSTKQLFNARTQQIEEAELSVDQNNEIVATFHLRDEDGKIIGENGFVKFPPKIMQRVTGDDGVETMAEVLTTPEMLDGLMTQHQSSNEGQEVITPEVEKRQEELRALSLSLIGEAPDESVESEAPTNGNTMPESQSNDTPNPAPTNQA